MKVQNAIENRTANKDNVIGFGYTDAKGREHGYRMYTFEMDSVTREIADNDYSTWTTRLPAGHYYGVIPQATKDGESWGASQKPEYFTSIEARDIWMAKRWAQALKNAEKKHGK